MVKAQELQRQANEIRKLTIRAIGTLGVGHIGGAVSICEVLSVLYFDVMRLNPDDPKDPARDRLVLSKGHGGPALYATLALKGYLPVEELDTLNQPGTRLPSHCDMRLTTGIDMTTGSLGQGFSAACGMAKAAQIDGSNLFVYTIIGDGESQEGQIWEAARFAAAKRLDNLIAFTDYNKMQIDGYVQDVDGLDPLDEKWKAFGWHVQTVDGHDTYAIRRAVDTAQKIKGRPSMIILDTIKGKGCNFCENDVGNHNMPISEEMWKGAVAALEEEGC